jgi:hypothetical protein
MRVRLAAGRRPRCLGERNGGGGAREAGLSIAFQWMIRPVSRLGST